MEQENRNLKKTNTDLESKVKDIYEDFEAFKEQSQIELKHEKIKLDAKIKEIHMLQREQQNNQQGTENVVDDLQCRLLKTQQELASSQNEVAFIRNANQEESANLNNKLTASNDRIMELESQIKELQQFNVHEMDDSMEMLEIPNGTETTTLYSELEDQRLDLSQKYNKLLRQYRYLRSQQSLYSMKSNEQVYELEQKLLESMATVNELKLVKINEMMVFKNDTLPNGEKNYLSSGYGHKHELLNRTLHKQVVDLANENKELRKRHLNSLIKQKSINDKMQELNQMITPKEQNTPSRTPTSPSKRVKLEQQENECKTQ